MRLFYSALIIGLSMGTTYGLMAFGLVATYRISRVVDLGLAGVAAFGAMAFYFLTSEWGAPIIVSLVLAMIGGALVGAALGYANLRMSHWPKGFVMIFTLCVTLLLFAFVDKVLPASGHTAGGVEVLSPFGSGGFSIGLTFVTAHQLGTMGVTIAVVLAATALIRYTRFGLCVRAIYDDPAGASTVGIPLPGYVIGVGAMAGAMASLAGILVTHRTLLNTLALLFLTVWGLAGAVLGGLESFPLAFAGGVLLGCAQAILGGMYGASLPPGTENLSAVVIMAIAVLYAGTRKRHLGQLQAT